MRKFVFLSMMLLPNMLHAFPEKPICPSPAAIKAASIQYVELNGDSWVGVIANHAFDTNTTWTFKMASIPAHDKFQAQYRAGRALSTLQLENGPIRLDLYGGWGCSYQSAKGYTALAITPAWE